MAVITRDDWPQLAYAAATLLGRLAPAGLRFRWREPAGRLLGALWHRLDSEHAALTGRNMRLILGERLVNGRLDTLIKAHFQNSAENRYVNDLLPELDLAQLEQFVNLEGREHLDAALAQGRGAILLQSHLGAHGYAPMMLLKRLGYSFTAVVGQEMGEDFSDSWVYRRLVYPIRSRVECEFQQPDARILFPSGRPQREIADCLRQNHLLLIWGDHVNGELLRLRPPNALPVSFLGHQVCLKTGPFRLAHWLCAPILPCFMVPRPGGFTWRVEPPLVFEPGSPTQRLANSLAAYAGRLESYFWQFPERWILWRAECLAEWMNET